VDNAIKFSEKRAAIHIKVEREGSLAVISIKDQGPGIDNENLETIFRKFYTATARSDDGQQGAGMGLAISKAIIKGHKGSIRVEIEKGVSTTFYVSLSLEDKNS
jgi:signal transduction histidine kinase